MMYIKQYFYNLTVISLTLCFYLIKSNLKLELKVLLYTI